MAYPRYGYRRIRSALAKECWTVSRKQVQRIRRREGLKVRPKPKKISRRGVSTGLPTQATHPHHVWTWDFIFDRTDNGGTALLCASGHGHSAIVRRLLRAGASPHEVDPQGWSALHYAARDGHYPAVQALLAA